MSVGPIEQALALPIPDGQVLMVSFILDRPKFTFRLHLFSVSHECLLPMLTHMGFCNLPTIWHTAHGGWYRLVVPLAGEQVAGKQGY
jgi:hypothetical protein